MSASESKAAAAYRMRCGGEMFKAIAEDLGISAKRAQQLYRFERHRVDGCWGIGYCRYCGKRMVGA